MQRKSIINVVFFSRFRKNNPKNVPKSPVIFSQTKCYQLGQMAIIAPLIFQLTSPIETHGASGISQVTQCSLE